MENFIFCAVHVPFTGKQGNNFTLAKNVKKNYKRVTL